MSLCKDEQIDKYLEMVRVKCSIRDVMKFDNIFQPSFPLTNYIYLYKKERNNPCKPNATRCSDKLSSC